MLPLPITDGCGRSFTRLKHCTQHEVCDLHDTKGIGGTAWKCPCPSGCKIRNGGYIKGENLGRHLELHVGVADVDERRDRPDATTS